MYLSNLLTLSTTGLFESAKIVVIDVDQIKSPYLPRLFEYLMVNYLKSPIKD